MKNIYKILIVAIVLIIAIAGSFTLFGKTAPAGEGPSYNASALSQKISINMDNWSYDEENDIYYQIRLIYCMNPEDTKYQSCGIYVPGKYFEASETQTEHMPVK